ncbi:cobalamin biosynthesis protein [Lipingzhangella rawalii]|uniref:cobalamin biosynthesis protein n=1 Tax=Lipingzhangella rawalii TaxID=2055835 RepID=UPI0038992374
MRTDHPTSGPAVAGGLLAGVALDRVLGDPRRGHPVAVFGAAATRLEQRLYAPTRLRGAAYLALCLAAVVAPAVGAHRCLRTVPGGHTAAVALATWASVGATTLEREAEGIAAALERGDLADARNRLPRLCGRDPRDLDTSEISRATVESVAENTSDAVVAPLFWGALLGLPGLLGHRVINTCDAMVGHRCARYTNFGWAAARLDDLANWVPARLTALATVATARFVGGSPTDTSHARARYGRHHPSPNAGQCEAAFAGALGVRLGGANRYQHTVDHRPELGSGRRPEPADIRRAVRLGRAVTAVSTVVAAAAALALSRRAGGRP